MIKLEFVKSAISTYQKLWQQLGKKRLYGFCLFLGIATFLLVALLQPAIATPSPQPIVKDQIKNLSRKGLLAQSDAWQLLEQGNRFYEDGRLMDAVSVWQQALQIYRDRFQQGKEAEKFNARLDTSLCLSYLSMAYKDLGQWEQAQTAIAKSSDLLDRETVATREGLAIAARVSNTKGSLQLAMGQSQAALETWQLASVRYAQLQDEIGQLGSQMNQAQALQALGLYRRSRNLLAEIELGWQKQPDSALKSMFLRSFGVTVQTLGDLSRAQQLFQQSLEISQQLNNPAEISATLLSLGHNFRFVQNTNAALQTYEKAAKVALNDIQRLEAQAAQLNLLAQLDRNSDFQIIWAQIEPQLKNLKPSRQNIYLQVNIANSLIDFNDRGDRSVEVAQIADLLTVATRQAQDLQDRRAESLTIGELGRLYAQNQQLIEAQKFAQRAIKLAQASNAEDLLYRWQWLLGKTLNQQGQYEQATTVYGEAVKNVQVLRKDLIFTSPEVQFAFRDRIEPIYRELVALLLREPQPPQANLKQARQTLEALQVAELENFFRSSCLDVKLQQIDAIDVNSSVLYSVVLPDRLAIILSLPNTPLRYYATAISKSEVEATADLYLQSMNIAFSDRERLKISQKLYDWMIRPAEKALSEKKIGNLVFVLDGSLRNLPLAALHDRQQFLIEKYSLALTPGMQLLGAQPLDRNQLRVWLGALSEARQGFGDLPGVKEEAAQIAKQIPTNLELNDNFTKSNLQKGMGKSDFPIVHLATHGQFSSKAESTYILTWNNRITVPDFYDFLRERTNNHNYPLELLVLSACQTAEGDSRAALGLAGLALRSGARSTIGSLWSIDDISTSKLMSNFYDTLKNKSQISRAEALQKAQLSLLRDNQYKHPYYWAAFVLVGSWL